jgi:hypothetical protein
MTMEKRLLWALLAILVFFALNLGVHAWGDRARRESLEDLERGLRRQLLISAIEKHLSAAHREIALVAGLLGGQGSGPMSPEAREAFTERLERIDSEIARLREIPGSTPAAGRFSSAWRDLRASWLKAARENARPGRQR